MRLYSCERQHTFFELCDRSSDLAKPALRARYKAVRGRRSSLALTLAEPVQSGFRNGREAPEPYSVDQETGRIRFGSSTRERARWFGFPQEREAEERCHGVGVVETPGDCGSIGDALLRLFAPPGSSAARRLRRKLCHRAHASFSRDFIAVRPFMYEHAATEGRRTDPDLPLLNPSCENESSSRQSIGSFFGDRAMAERAGDVTRILEAIKKGDDGAQDRLFAVSSSVTSSPVTSGGGSARYLEASRSPGRSKRSVARPGSCSSRSSTRSTS